MSEQQMMTLIDKINKKMAQMQLDMARCYDPYRLNQLMINFSVDINNLGMEAKDMVEQLESIYRPCSCGSLICPYYDGGGDYQ